MKSNLNVLALLGLIFVTLKLCGVIGWSWWLVTLPFWGAIAIWLAIVIVGIVLAGVIGLISVALTYRK